VAGRGRLPFEHLQKQHLVVHRILLVPESSAARTPGKAPKHRRTKTSESRAGLRVPGQCCAKCLRRGAAIGKPFGPVFPYFPCPAGPIQQALRPFLIALLAAGVGWTSADAAGEVRGSAQSQNRGEANAVVWLEAPNPPVVPAAPRIVLDQRNLTF